MNILELRDAYNSGQFDTLVDAVRSEWPKSGLPTPHSEWAEACHLAMVAAFRFCNQAAQIGDVAAEQTWERQGELWRGRSFACAIVSGNLITGAVDILGLGELARFKGRWKLAAEISSAAVALLDRATESKIHQVHPPLDEARRMCHEMHAQFLCDAMRKNEMAASFDQAIEEARVAQQYCGKNRRSTLKVKGTIANMLYWKGERQAAIEQTSEVLAQARSENHQVFFDIADANLKAMRNGSDALKGYQVA